MRAACARAALSLSILFALLVSAIRAQPFTPHPAFAEYRALLDDCEPGCLFGISAGTDASQIVGRLEAHDWIAQVRIRPWSSASYGVEWLWSSTAPDWIDIDHPGFIRVIDGHVARLELRTRLTLGDLLLGAGVPEALTLETLAISRDVRQVAGGELRWREKGSPATWNLVVFCPFRRLDLWRVPIFAVIESRAITSLRSIRSITLNEIDFCARADH